MYIHNLGLQHTLTAWFNTEDSFCMYVCIWGNIYQIPIL